jgi:hypothetical protein
MFLSKAITIYYSQVGTCWGVVVVVVVAAVAVAAAGAGPIVVAATMIANMMRVDIDADMMYL